ncbi:hypothetical protein LSTR_LSTR015115 [Laodelphax striatellus]|uniref:Thymidine kinase n=1 Tax=Laodelphax striatellus TaxID=195883 RepID=A0A482X3M8_LAOST|nr:hypothetical protein LSTR_LSTR015115 [Laodelphax striatellus]
MSNHLNGTNSSSGQIQVIFGPMFSGKSTELIRRMKRYRNANYRCLMIRYAKDMRYSEDSVSTHDGQQVKAMLATELSKFNSWSAVDVIGIDEGQFFPDVVEFSEKAANLGKIVLVAALDGTYQRTGFSNILTLVPLAEKVDKLTAVCMSCFKDAAFTRRIGCEKEVELIGGAEKYMAVCRDCYRLEHVVKQSPCKEILSSNIMDVENINVPQRRNLFGSNSPNKKISWL